MTALSVLYVLHILIKPLTYFLYISCFILSPIIREKASITAVLSRNNTILESHRTNVDFTRQLKHRSLQIIHPHHLNLIHRELEQLIIRVAFGPGCGESSVLEVFSDVLGGAF